MATARSFKLSEDINSTWFHNSSPKVQLHSVAIAATVLRNCVAQALSRGDGSRHSLQRFGVISIIMASPKREAILFLEYNKYGTKIA